MKLRIDIENELGSYYGIDGRAVTLPTGPARVTMVIETDTDEGREIMDRLRGLPGLPEPGEAIERISPPMSPPVFADEFGEDPGALPEDIRPEGLRDWDSQKARMISMTEKELDKLERGDWGTNWKKAAIEFRKRQKRAQRAAENRQRRAMVEKMKAAERAGVDPEKWIPPWERKPNAPDIELLDDFVEQPRALNPSFRRNIEIED